MAKDKNDNRRSYRVPNPPVGPDPAVNALGVFSDDARDVGVVPGGWDNDRGQWTPYRGAESHGVPFSTDTLGYNPELGDGLGGTNRESMVVLPEDSGPDIKPVPVRIVDTTTPEDERHGVRVNSSPANALDPARRLVGTNGKRSALHVRVLATGSDIVYVGTDSRVSELTGWPLTAAAPSLNWAITEELWMIPAAANAGTVRVYTAELYTQTVKPE